MNFPSFSWPTPPFAILEVFKRFSKQTPSEYGIEPSMHPALVVVEKAHGLPIMIKLDCIRVILGGDDFTPEVLDAFGNEICMEAHLRARSVGSAAK